MSDNRGAEALRSLIEVSYDSNQAALAAALGLSQSHVSRLARGETKPKRRDQALVLRKKAGIAVEWWDEPPVQTKRPRERRNPSAA
ncbi:MAG TPA: helix-turn-helix domain-containing protein [Polyangiaceae bacterium]